MTESSITCPQHTCVIAQPTFLPWIGWFDLVDQSNSTIILDDVQFSKQSWQQRNRLRSPEGLKLLSVPVKSSGRSHQSINKVELASEATAEKMLSTIQGYYARAPFFRENFVEFEEVFRAGFATGKLSELNIGIICWAMRKLDINTPIALSSSLKSNGRRGEYVAALCEDVGATRYLTPAGAEGYLLEDRAAFDRRKIEVVVHQYAHPTYQQCFSPFEPYASIIDLIFNSGSKSAAIMRSGRKMVRPLGENATNLDEWQREP